MVPADEVLWVKQKSLSRTHPPKKHGTDMGNARFFQIAGNQLREKSTTGCKVGEPA